MRCSDSYMHARRGWWEFTLFLLPSLDALRASLKSGRNIWVRACSMFWLLSLKQALLWYFSSPYAINYCIPNDHPQDTAPCHVFHHCWVAVILFCCWFFSIVVPRHVIEINFRSLSPNGVLLYAADNMQSPSKFLAIELVNGRLVFKFNTGSGLVRVQSGFNTYAIGGQWYEVSKGSQGMTVEHRPLMSVNIFGCF